MSKKKLLGLDSATYVAIIGDEDTVTGFLLAGIGNADAKGTTFFLTDSKTKPQDIESAFRRLSHNPEVAIILITQAAAQEIRYLLDEYDRLIPTILEIPSKDSPYDPAKDSLLKRVRRLIGKRD
eukprot:CAMPEP_0184665828 /NCGR_PEP_ID=MMETSP0308-20130426/58810_1 /TAXON_ID=38269 /ORGANISM="Gloeochaete witrockiana, Strain SAG 46.84" /LENGTH=123 /DNA_ID=CAMNT_0027110061 /DNA_START=16 /DNA_END=387 /DNA_ORIENTATION=+